MPKWPNSAKNINLCIIHPIVRCTITEESRYWIIVDCRAARNAANLASDWRFLYTAAGLRLDHDDADNKRKLYIASNQPERAHRSPARLRLAPIRPKSLEGSRFSS